MKDATTLVIVAHVIAKTCEQHGVPQNQLYAHAGIDPPQEAEEYARIPAQDMRKLWTSAAQLTRNPDIGFEAGMSVQPATLKALGLSWLASRCLLDGLKRFCDFSKLISNKYHFALVVQLDTVSVQAVDLYPSMRTAVHGLDFAAALIIQMCRLTAAEMISPQLAIIPKPLWTQRRAVYIKELLGCDVEISSQTCTMVFSRDVLNKPLLTASDELTAVNDEILRRHFQQSSTSYSEAVKAQLLKNNSYHNVAQSEVASRLHMSSKTLQRRLADEDETFSSLQDDTREALAKNYLAKQHYSMKKTALLLGFSSTSAFSNAFKRWTGVSPSAFLHGSKATNV